MYSILIVDDEPKHRRGLANWTRNFRPDYKVFEAKTGKEALDIVNRNSIDIVITDIKMPVMNGIELIEKISGRSGNIKTILLSAYGEFSYAQKAINIGVSDYIIKPVDEKKFLQIVEKMEKQIYYENEKIMMHEEIIEKLNLAMPVYLEHILNKWVHDDLSNPELNKIKEYFSLNGRGLVFIVDLSQYDLLRGSYKTDDYDDIRSNIKNWIQDFVKEVGLSISFFSEENRLQVISILSNENESTDFPYRICQKMNGLIETINSEYGIKVTVGVSSEYKDIYDGIHGAFIQASEAINYKFFTGVGKVILYPDIRCLPSNHFLKFYNGEEKLIKAIQCRDKKGTVEILDRMLELELNDGYPNPRIFTESLTHSLFNVAKVLENVMGDKYYILNIDNYRRRLNSCMYFNEFRMEVEKILMEIIDTIINTGKLKKDFLINDCFKYIEEHYNEEISLLTISEEFHFNSSYFSDLFKRHTGITFSQYLFKLRIKKAQKLLAESTEKICTIAEKVGYKDVKYFYRIFKNEYGITPYEYRKQLSNKTRRQ